MARSEAMRRGLRRCGNVGGDVALVVVMSWRLGGGRGDVVPVVWHWWRCGKVRMGGPVEWVRGWEVRNLRAVGRFDGFVLIHSRSLGPLGDFLL